MRILYAASEANPFAKSGGLADVAGALPKALVKDGVDARVIMPLYGDLKFRDKLEYVTNYSVPVGWRSQYCGLFKAEVDGVTYYFLDNEYYFKRRGLYGFYDDGERFAFFSRAVLETLFYIDFTPDIINCNDWQTALVPASSAPTSAAVRVTTPPWPFTLFTGPSAGAVFSARSAAASARAAPLSAAFCAAPACPAAVTVSVRAASALFASFAAAPALFRASCALVAALFEYASTRATKVSYCVGLISASPSVASVS